ncbi:MAG: hypothetical protein ACRDP5_24080 [Streptosporangiaceae bacterium]
MSNVYTPYNICQGPADVYWAVFGSTEPADSAVTSAPNSSVWTGVGGTEDGQPVLFEEDLTYSDQTIDQVPIAVGGRLTKRTAQITFAMEETTLDNLLLAINQLGTVNVQSGYTTFDPAITSSATQPTYTALIIDGWGPTLSTGAAARRRIIARKCLTSSKVALAYQKDKPATFAVTWNLYYVSASIPDHHVVEQNA